MPTITVPFLVVSGQAANTVRLYASQGGQVKGTKTITNAPVGTWQTAQIVVQVDGVYGITGTVTDANGSSGIVYAHSSIDTTAPPPSTSTKPWIGGNTTFHIDWSHIMPLANCWKTCRDPRRDPVNSSGTQTWDDNDELVTNTGSVYTAFAVSWPEFPKGTYVAEWSGTGHIKLNNVDVTTSGGTVNIQSGAGPEGGVSVEIFGVCRNIKIYLQGHDPDGVHPDFKAKFEQLGVIRFMDLMWVNSSPIETIAELPKKSDSFYTKFRVYDKDGFSIRRDGIGLPIEVCCEIAKACGAIPWLHVYHQLDANGAAEMARRAKAVMGDLPCIVEYSNECWNDRPDFQQTNWVRQRGIEAGLDADQYAAGYKFYVRRAIEVFRAWSAVYPNSKRVLAWQQLEAKYSDYWQINNVLLPEIAAINGQNDYDVWSISGYHGGRVSSVDEWFNNVDAYMAETKTSWDGFRANVLAQTGKDFYVYEGNWSGNGPTEIMRDPRFKAKLEKHFDDAADAGIDLYCVYTPISKNGSNDGWGILDHQSQSTSPGWEAILAKKGLKTFTI